MRTGCITATIIGVAAGVLLLSGCTSEKVSAEGTWGTSGEGEPQLVLEKDGKLTGTDGCNRLMGAWEQTDEKTVTFIDVASTMMACEDVDTWLVNLDTGHLEGETLRIEDVDGTEIGTLAKAARQ